MSTSTRDGTIPGFPDSDGNGAGAADYLRSLLRAFIRGNGFYVISMVLVVYGCHRHVHATVTSGPQAEFSRTLLSLGILQAYELLVIATAAMVVRRLRILGDAGTLLLIEAALLLDPTFFANSFLTMRGGQGVFVNLGCLVLVPLKLLLLQRLVGVRLSGRGWAGFCLAATVVYLAPWPLDRAGVPFLSLYGYYYLIGVAATLTAVLLPPAGEVVRFRHPAGEQDSSGDREFVTSAQRVWISRFLIGLPLLVAAAHYIETASVYTLGFYPANLAPLLLAVGVLAVSNAQRGAGSGTSRRTTVDLMVALALLLSLPIFNTPSKYDMLRPAWALPEFIRSPWPLLIVGTGVVALYVWEWVKFRDAAALRRLALLAAGAVFYGLLKSGFVGLISSGVGRGAGAAGRGIGWIAEQVGYGLDRLFKALGYVIGLAGELVYNNPVISLSLMLALALWLAYRYPRMATWFPAGLLILVIAFRQLPGGATPHLAEFFQLLMVMIIFLSHRFHGDEERGGRLFGALLVMGVALVRLYHWPGAWTTGFAVAQVFLLLAAWRVWKDRGYFILAVLHGAAVLWLLGRTVSVEVQPAFLMIAGGMALFALAVYVSFNKDRLLDRLQAPPPPPLPMVAPLAEDEMGEVIKEPEP